MLQCVVVGKGRQKIDLIDVKNVTSRLRSNTWNRNALASPTPNLFRSLIKLFCVLRLGLSRGGGVTVFKAACTVNHRFPNLRSLLNASDARCMKQRTVAGTGLPAI